MLVPRLGRQLALTTALLVAVGAAVLGGLSARLKIESFQPIGFHGSRAGGSWRVESVDHPTTGLRPGDAILLVDGVAPATASELSRRLRARPRADLLLTRDGVPQTVGYVRPDLSIDGAYLLLALAGLAYLVIGFYTLTRERRPASTLFFLWCVASASVYLLTSSYPFDTLAKIIFSFEELARLVLPPLTLHLFLCFPRPLWKAGTQRLATAVAYLPFLLLAGAQLDLVLFDGRFALGPGSVELLRRLDRLELFHLVAFAMIALGILAVRLGAREHAEERRQLQWIAVGLAGGYLPFLLLYLLPFAAGLRTSTLVQLAAVAPLVLVPLTFAYAILRYKLWDLGILVRDGLSYVVTLVVGVGAFSLAQQALSTGIPSASQNLQQLLSGATGLLLAAVMIPTSRAVRGGLERLYYFSTYGRRRALVDYGRHLLQTRDLGDLREDLIAELESTLSLSPVDLVLLDDEGARIPLRDSDGPTVGETVDLPETTWDADVIRLSPFGLPDADDRLPQQLYRLGHRYIFPLTAHDKRLGFLVCGHRDGDSPLSSEDLDLIRAFLNQAVLAIENAHLMSELRGRLAEVVRLQRHNQGIVERSPAGIVVVDGEDHIRSANPAFETLVGRAELQGMPLGEVLPVQPLPSPHEGLVEVSYCDANRRAHYLQLSVAEHDQQDAGLRILVVLDVSDRVAMENTLREQERLAALGMLAAGVAHEVNTPITGISSYAQMLLAQTSPDDERFELLSKIERQTFRAASIVNSLLEFARDHDQQQQPVSVARVLDETIRMLVERLQERHIELRWSPPADLPMVAGHPGELEQVFTNLLVNAIDAMDDRGVLDLAVWSDDRRVVARVADSGRGIPKEDLEHIFRPFYSTKLKSGGTGLGLSISYQIIRRHGGEIHVRSEPGHGTTFEIELPIAPPPGTGA